MYNSEIEAIIDESLKQDFRILDFSNNPITYLPDSIGQLSNLTHLCLANNLLITYLPDSISQLTNL
ncbi:hypothetical protein [Stanieria cyanosphaera]|uniref:hypothetical protein n=1 Tax=Stanieria cyanosphaera TaxID=102116 RepID=UPI00031A7CB8|nr:hypothetical protein [Stanieria cyanosphaera]